MFIYYQIPMVYKGTDNHADKFLYRKMWYSSPYVFISLIEFNFVWYKTHADLIKRYLKSKYDIGGWNWLRYMGSVCKFVINT